MAVCFGLPYVRFIVQHYTLITAVVIQVIVRYEQRSVQTKSRPVPGLKHKTEVRMPVSNGCSRLLCISHFLVYRDVVISTTNRACFVFPKTIITENTSGSAFVTRKLSVMADNQYLHVGKDARPSDESEHQCDCMSADEAWCFIWSIT